MNSLRKGSAALLGAVVSDNLTSLFAEPCRLKTLGSCSYLTEPDTAAASTQTQPSRAAWPPVIYSSGVMTYLAAR